MMADLGKEVAGAMAGWKQGGRVREPALALKLYHLVHRLCTAKTPNNKAAAECYALYKQTIQDFHRTHLAPQLPGRGDERFTSALAQLWESHSFVSNELFRMFMYLDR